MKTTLLLLTAVVSLALALPIEHVSLTKETDAMNKRDSANANAGVLDFRHKFGNDGSYARQFDQDIVGGAVHTVTGVFHF